MLHSASTRSEPKTQEHVILPKAGFSKFDEKGLDPRNILMFFALVLANGPWHEREAHPSKVKTETLQPRFQHLFNTNADKQPLQNTNSSLKALE